MATKLAPAAKIFFHKNIVNNLQTAIVFSETQNFMGLTIGSITPLVGQNGFYE